MTSFLLLVLIFISFKASTSVDVDTCTEIQKCINPVLKFESIKQAMPVMPEAQRLCRRRTDAYGVIKCLDAFTPSSCSDIGTRSQSALVYVILTAICQPGNEGLFTSTCSMSASQRNLYKTHLKQSCGVGLGTKVKEISTGKRTGEDVCNDAHALYDCATRDLTQFCGSYMTFFIQRLWGAVPSRDCPTLWNYSYMLYQKLTPAWQ